MGLRFPLQAAVMVFKIVIFWNRSNYSSPLKRGGCCFSQAPVQSGGTQWSQLRSEACLNQRLSPADAIALPALRK